MRRLGKFFSQTSFTGLDRAALLTKFLHRVIGLFNGAGGVYLHEVEDNLSTEITLLSRQLQQHEEQLTAQLLETGEQALAGQELQTISLDASGTLHGILCPLVEDRGCLCLLLVSSREDLPPFLLGLQLLAVLLDRYLHSDCRQPSFYQELLARMPAVLSASPGREQLLVLNQALKEICRVEVTALARHTDRNKTELTAISDLATLDQRTEKARLLRQGLEECILRDTTLAWPATGEQASPVLEGICGDYGMKNGLALPLHDQENACQGALLLLWKTGPQPARLARELAPILPFIGTLVARSRAGKRSPLAGKQKKQNFSLQNRVIMAVAIGLLLLLLVPFPYKIHTDGLVRPKITRFVVARYNGILRECLVRPGDQVKKGDILARLDRRETETRLAALRAERDKAKKMFDQAMARGATAAAQLARLDMLRYEEQLKEIQDQQRHLIIRSPVTGMVLSGDLQRAEGSPVSRGQTLFEVAPLDRMEVEVAIPEEDISLVPEHAAVILRFVAYPNQAWSGDLVRIEPKARIWENRNVFIGILEFDNQNQLLHPGMRAGARVKTGTRLLGWILFRKPWYTLKSLADTLLSR